jgi:hypothetical protein
MGGVEWPSLRRVPCAHAAIESAKNSKTTRDRQFHDMA